MQVEYKYKSYFDAMECACPSDVSTLETVAYRFCNGDVNDSRNWEPVAFIPDRKSRANQTCSDKCPEYGLSFFLKREKAESKYKKLVTQYPSLADRLGGGIAMGYICKCDGNCDTPTASYSHFNLFEFAGVHFKGRFIHLGKIPL